MTPGGVEQSATTVDDATEGAQAPRRLFRRLLPWSIRRAAELAALALIIEYILLPQVAGSHASFHHLLDVDSPWLVLCLLAELASLTCFACATRAMLPPQHRPTLWRVLRIDLSTIALSHSVPGGSAAGTALGMRLLADAGIPASEAAFAKVAQGVGSAIVLEALLFTGLAVTIPLHGASPIYLAASIAGAAIIAIVGAVLLVLRYARPRLGRILDRITSRIPRVPDDGGSRFVAHVGGQLDLVMGNPQQLATVAAWSAANWLFDAFALWTALRAFGHSFGYNGLIVSYAIANTLGWLPITPGGLGIVEGVLVPLLVAFGATRAVAILGVIVWRLIAFWLPIPIGAVAYTSLWQHSRRFRMRR